MKRQGLVVLLGVFFSANSVADTCIEETGCRRFTGVGVSIVRHEDPRPESVKQLLAIRAARVEAIRSLAEQILGVTVQGESAVNASEIVSDKFTANTQGLLNGVRFVKVEPVQPGVYQAVVEIDIKN